MVTPARIKGLKKCKDIKCAAISRSILVATLFLTVMVSDQSQLANVSFLVSAIEVHSIWRSPHQPPGSALHSIMGPNPGRVMTIKVSFDKDQGLIVLHT